MKKRLPRLYAPFFKKSKDDKRWIRATWPASDKGLVPEHPRSAYPLNTAIRVYQDWLLAPFMEGIDEIRELRPIPVKDKEYDKHPETWQD